MGAVVLKIKETFAEEIVDSIQLQLKKNR